MLTMKQNLKESNYLWSFATKIYEQRKYFSTIIKTEQRAIG